LRQADLLVLDHEEARVILVRTGQHPVENELAGMSGVEAEALLSKDHEVSQSDVEIDPAALVEPIGEQEQP
jgi:hypothetical protein